MEQFMENLTKPDNLPIVGLLFLVLFFTGLALKEAILNDRLTKQGKSEEIAKRME